MGIASILRISVQKLHYENDKCINLYIALHKNTPLICFKRGITFDGYLYIYFLFEFNQNKA